MLNIDYIPDRDDIIWIDFNPQSVKKQMGYRPALVISDQIKSLDWKMRKAEFIEKLNTEKVVEVISKILILIK